MTVVVTGATGHLGGAVLRRLRAEGTPAVGLGRDPAKLEALREEGFTVQPCDLSAGLPETLEGSAIIHAAALSAPFGPWSAFERANIAATRAVIAWAEARTARLFHISSPSVHFAFCDDLGRREDTPLPGRFANHYARSKAEAERLVQASRAPGLILRPRGIYGPNDTSLLPRLLRAARRGPLPRFRGGRAAIDLTYIDDAVDAVLAALRAERSDQAIINVSGGEVLPVREIAEAACARAGVPVRWRNIPFGMLMLAARAMETGAALLPGQPEPPATRYSLGLFAYQQSLNLDRARDFLGWTPSVRFEEGLARSFAP
ncbi:NAD-dependent epimerase/dehydratase family protein [Paracoccaceae bacterium GXU_MW_L88]